MLENIKNMFYAIMPLRPEQKELLSGLDDYLQKDDLKEVRYLLRHRMAQITESSFNLSPQLLPGFSFPEIQPGTPDKRIISYIQKLNSIILKKAKQKAFHEFSKNAATIIPRFIAMNIVGMDYVKKAVSLQLFSKERFHILLLGDPGTGKTEILRSAAALSPISSFGLGSGTSSAGLTVTVSGKAVSKGLLPMADNGLCAIDELNLMDPKDRASLYNAMEKGFVSYDKGGNHFTFDARVRVLATANPKKDRFVGFSLETIKKQIPFDSALLSRFHLVFLIRKPDIRQFIKITEKIITENVKPKTEDERFISDYIRFAQSYLPEITIPGSFKGEIASFIGQIKRDEKKYIVEISPRLAIGFVRMAKASARMSLRDKVSKKDIELVKKIMLYGLSIRK